MATIQIHDSQLGWLDAATIKFGTSGNEVQIEYDIDYAQQHWARRDLFALSLTFPVSLDIYSGEVPGYIVDLVPQGQVLKRLLAQYGISRENDFQKILESIPLASPGNMRIKEPWLEVEEQRDRYRHEGFSKKEIVEANVAFIQYMMDHGSPVAGTSGAAGGAPKFLLREDFSGQFHADGYLDDRKTKKAWLVKFPFTDSSNSKMILKTEWAFSNVLTDLGLNTFGEYEWQKDVLFVPRFDRVPDAHGCLHYFGLESFYAAHGISQFGARLTHENNLRLVKAYSSNPRQDAIEYLKRDLVNQAFANTDNHGRNSSFIKREGEIRISPIYDVTAMKFFQGDMIIPLTTWGEAGTRFKDRLVWTENLLDLPQKNIKEEMLIFGERLSRLEERIESFSIPKEVEERSRSDRKAVLELLKNSLKD